MPEKVGLAQTLIPNVNTCTGQPLTFAESSCAVRLKDTVCRSLSFFSLLSVTFTLLCFSLHLFLLSLNAALPAPECVSAELWDALDKNRPFCKDLLQPQSWWRWRIVSKPSDCCDSYMKMAFLRHLFSLEYDCCLIDIFACAAEENPYMSVCLLQ